MAMCDFSFFLFTILEFVLIKTCYADRDELRQQVFLVIRAVLLNSCMMPMWLFCRQLTLMLSQNDNLHLNVYLNARLNVYFTLFR